MFSCHFVGPQKKWIIRKKPKKFLEKIPQNRLQCNATNATKSTNKTFIYNSMIVQLRSLRPNFKGKLL